MWPVSSRSDVASLRTAIRVTYLLTYLLNTAGVKRELLDTFKARKLAYYMVTP